MFFFAEPECQRETPTDKRHEPKTSKGINSPSAMVSATVSLRRRAARSGGSLGMNSGGLSDTGKSMTVGLMNPARKHRIAIDEAIVPNPPRASASGTAAARPMTGHPRNRMRFVHDSGRSRQRGSR